MMFSCEMAVIFGKPDTGKPIAAEHTNAVPCLEYYYNIDIMWIKQFLPSQVILGLDQLIEHQFSKR